jgi:polyhydroxybutyrate depolymerase
VAIVLLGGIALVVSTWKQLVRSLYIGMSGRPWLVKGSVFFFLSLLTLSVFLVARVLARERAFIALWRSLPWLLGALAAAKLLAAGWVVARLRTHRLLSDRALVGGAAAWLLAVTALYGMLAWIAALPASMPRHLLGLIAILVVPFVRLSAAPLALAWNRHRGAVAPERSDAARAGRHAVVGAVLLLIGLPVLMALAATVSFHLDARDNGTIIVDGEPRRYLLYVPKSYDPAVPAPLIISLHGGAMWPAQQMHLSGWNALADENGFLVVYPSGIGFPRRWRSFDAGPGLEHDVRFIAALIDALHGDYNIDPRRIYADGISNGGGMAFVLSCALAQRIAAVGAVAPGQSLPPEWCAGSRPVPGIVFHGDADHWVPYGGGVMPDRIGPDPPVFPAARDFVARWAERNRCAPVPTESDIAPEVTRRVYEDCAEGATVTLYTVHGGGHTWPGGEPLPEWAVGATTRDVDATRRMWAFYREHPLRAR